MVNEKEKLLDALAKVDIRDVRTAFVARVRIESGRIAGAREWMFENGFELLNIPDGALLTADGREVLRAHGKAWALKPEAHAQRLARAVAQARQPATQAEQQPQPISQPTLCVTLIDGHLCGGALIKEPVCPRCALGKQGALATLTCDVCGHVSAIMRGDA